MQHSFRFLHCSPLWAQLCVDCISASIVKLPIYKPYSVPLLSKFSPSFLLTQMDSAGKLLFWYARGRPTVEVKGLWSLIPLPVILFIPFGKHSQYDRSLSQIKRIVDLYSRNALFEYQSTCKLSWNISRFYSAHVAKWGNSATIKPMSLPF